MSDRKGGREAGLDLSGLEGDLDDGERGERRGWSGSGSSVKGYSGEEAFGEER
jgi:hypothetical protein